ncbi:MAG: hypothetical protein GF401_12480 [Chitinivibrionales bacterium]|nr:hypothetical protein [Chitinivibrionales bacterium]
MNFGKIAFLAGCVFSALAYLQKLEVTPYGFLKGDFYFAANGVVSWGTPALTSVSRASGVDSTAVSFTAQHTRLGLKIQKEEITVPFGGVAEIDFWVIAANFNAVPRMRLAYVWMKPLQNLKVDIGQRWDFFSPLNPTTNNTNANLWMNGNYGFRRPQFALTWLTELGRTRPVFQVSVGEASKEDQTRLGLEFNEDMETGVAALMAAYDEDREFWIWGISVDANLPVHRLPSFLAEFALGANLDNADLFTIGGDGTPGNDVRTWGFWINYISKPFIYLHGVAGFARESVYSGVAPGSPEDNTTFYLTARVPVNEHISLAAEYQFFYTNEQGLPDNHTASLIDVAGKLVF